MPDTPSNQAAFPQSTTQAPDLGFPMARIGALIGLASGAVLGYQVTALRDKGSGEQTVLLGLTYTIQPGDIVWVSFVGARRLLVSFLQPFVDCKIREISGLKQILMASIAKLKLPLRPDRIEPRAKKRRPKNLPLLTVPRHAARQAIRIKRALILVP